MPLLTTVLLLSVLLIALVTPESAHAAATNPVTICDNRDPQDFGPNGAKTADNGRPGGRAAVWLENGRGLIELRIITDQALYPPSPDCSWGRISYAPRGAYIWVDRSTDLGRTW